MNKTKISKIIISIITFALIVCISTNVFADDGLLDFDSDFTDSSTDGSTTDDNTTDGEENSDPIENLTPSENETTDEGANANTNVDTNPNENSGTNNTNTSTYEESDIPYAGPVENALMVTAFIIFGIIGIYTFKKLSDYSNL